MADIVGCGLVRLVPPYVWGTGGPPILVISHLTRTPYYAEHCPTPPPSPPSGTTFPPEGPILEERKRKDRRGCMCGRVFAWPESEISATSESGWSKCKFVSGV